MKKLLPLILAIVVGLGGYIYFNQNEISPFGVKQIHIYNYIDYKDKNPSPIIKIEKKNHIATIKNTVNSSKTVKRKVNLANPNYVLDIIYSKDKSESFNLWLNEATSSAMYKNTKTNKFLILSTEDTNKLKTLIYR